MGRYPRGHEGAIALAAGVDIGCAPRHPSRMSNWHDTCWDAPGAPTPGASARRALASLGEAPAVRAAACPPVALRVPILALA